MGTGPKTLADFIRIAGEVTAADFVRAHPHPFLVSSGVLGVRLPKASDEMASESTAIIDIRPGVSHAPSAMNPLAGQIHEIRKQDPNETGVVTVGRGDENDIVLADPSVSNTHGYFERADESVWVADIGSRNGTFVNQGRITVGEKVSLEDEDVVTFGRVSFQVFRPLALFMALLEFREAI